MRTEAGNRIFALLKGHRGEEQAITAPEIGLKLGIYERDVRAIIANEFREWIEDGGLLLSKPGKGFFFATEAEEISRRQACLISLKLQAGCKLADFHGAMKLAGFGGLVSDKIPETFTNASQPDQTERKRA